MERVRRFQFATVAAMVAILLVSGPLVGAVDLTPETRGAAALGDGTADASVAGDPTDGLVIDDGRFGTNVSYLRIPAATVDVETVEGRPRLLYRVEVPALGVDRSATERIGTGADRVTVRLDDVAIPHERIRNDSYRATVTLRVQSFEETRTVYNRSVSVPVRG